MKAKKPETVLRDRIRAVILSLAVIVKTNAQVGRTHRGGLGAGSADLMCCINGRWVELEVKMPDGKQSPIQRQHQVEVMQAGGVYAVVRSPEEALCVVMPLLLRKAS